MKKDRTLETTGAGQKYGPQILPASERPYIVSQSSVYGGYPEFQGTYTKLYIDDLDGAGTSGIVDEYIEFDFVQPTLVSQLTLRAGSLAGPVTFNGYNNISGCLVQHWDGSAWITDTTITNAPEMGNQASFSTNLRILPFTMVQTTKMRIFRSTSGQSVALTYVKWD
jgi:hypothetical protein